MEFHQMVICYIQICLRPLPRSMCPKNCVCASISDVDSSRDIHTRSNDLRTQRVGSRPDTDAGPPIHDRTYSIQAPPIFCKQPTSKRGAGTPRIYVSQLRPPIGYRTLACNDRDTHKIGFRILCTLRLFFGIRSRDAAMTGSGCGQLH